MSSPVDIEVGKLSHSNQETTRINSDGSERCVHLIQSLLIEIIAMLKGFVSIQQNFAEM